MDGKLNDLRSLPDVTGEDIETLLAVLTAGSRRVERVALSSGAVWIKRYGTEKPPIWTHAQRALAALIGHPFLRPSPFLDRKGMVERETRRIADLAAHGFAVPKVLYASGASLVLSDAGMTVTALLGGLKTEDPVAHDDLLVRCADELGRLHAAGLCHGRPHMRDLFLFEGRIGFMDFEEEPEAVMPLATAQARDLWLLFQQLVLRARLGEVTADRAYRAWSATAPVAAQQELRVMNAFLAKFLSLTRLIGRVHMGSDLRRFIAATHYLSQVFSNAGLNGASKAGKDD
jgi:tRNA A-37 threonylcarbamoyl transferase component Bud32